MKIFAAVIMLFFASQGMASVEANVSEVVQVETSIGQDRGKKRARRHKKVNRKRKRRCNRSARRNFAG